MKRTNFAVGVWALFVCCYAFRATPLGRRPAFQSATMANPAFEAATIKPHGPDGPNGITVGGSCHGVDTKVPGSSTPQGRCVFTRVPLFALLNAAYFPPVGIGNPRRFTGGPSWVNDEFWDVQAKAENPDTATEQQLRQMLQTLLAERFKARFHLETEQTPGYALVVAKGGMKIKEDTSGAPMRMSARNEDYVFTNYPLANFTQYISSRVGLPVVDRTGAAGGYTFSLHMPPALAATTDGSSAETGPSIFTMLEEQFGLRLESQKVSRDVIVIDNAERPAE